MNNRADETHPVLQPVSEENVIEGTNRFLTALRFDQMPVSVELRCNCSTVATWVPHVYCDGQPRTWTMGIPMNGTDVWSVTVEPETVQVVAETTHHGTTHGVRSLEPLRQDGTFYYGVVLDLIAAHELDLVNTTVTVCTGETRVLDRVPLAALERGYCKDTVFWKEPGARLRGPLTVTVSPPLDDYDAYGLTVKETEGERCLE